MADNNEPEYSSGNYMLHCPLCNQHSTPCPWLKVNIDGQDHYMPDKDHTDLFMDRHSHSDQHPMQVYYSL